MFLDAVGGVSCTVMGYQSGSRGMGQLMGRGASLMRAICTRSGAIFGSNGGYGAMSYGRCASRSACLSGSVMPCPENEWVQSKQAVVFFRFGGKVRLGSSEG